MTIRRKLYERRNSALLPWLRTAVLAGAVLLALTRLPFYPAPAVMLVVAAVAVLGLLAPTAATLVAVSAIALPLAAGDLLAGVVFLLVGFGSVAYRDDRGTSVAFVAVAAVAATLHAEWAAVAAAGLLLGPSEGAAVAVIACLFIEGTGIVFGSPAIGATATGSAGRAAALVTPGALAAVKDPLAFGWVMRALTHIDLERTRATLLAIRPLLAVVGQPLAWAAGATAAGMLRPKASAPGRRIRSLAAAAAGTVVAGVLSGAVALLSHAPITTTSVGLGLVASLGVTAIVVAVCETVFAPRRVVDSEDVDVDALLREIAREEEALASDVAVERTVVITDMTSFSRLTQELGSAEVSKLVRQHRDLVLPIFERHGGRGMAAGGDGILAAFESPRAALDAVIEMQRALEEFNRSGGPVREVSLRTGIALGEVVLDRGGRPFLGDALNIAARIMSLADGGQVLTSVAVAEAAGDQAPPLASHGRFTLRNIAQPVHVMEVLWKAGQEPRAPLAVAPAEA